MDKAIRVVIAFDQPIFRDGLRILLKAVKGFEVVGEACNGQEAVQITQRVEPDILLLDLAIRDLSGLEALRELSGKSLPTRTIILALSIGRYDAANVNNLLGHDIGEAQVVGVCERCIQFDPVAQTAAETGVSRSWCLHQPIRALHHA